MMLLVQAWHLACQQINVDDPIWPDVAFVKLNEIHFLFKLRCEVVYFLIWLQFFFNGGSYESWLPQLDVPVLDHNSAWVDGMYGCYAYVFELFQGNSQEIHEDIGLGLAQPAFEHFSFLQVVEQVALITVLCG